MKPNQKKAFASKGKTRTSTAPEFARSAPFAMDDEVAEMVADFNLAEKLQLATKFEIWGTQLRADVLRRSKLNKGARRL